MSSMVIVCEGCGARFRMNHALFKDAKGARIRCRKCGGHIEVRHPEALPVPSAPEVPGAVRYDPAPTAVPVFPTEIPLPHAPSSDDPLPPAKAEPEKEASLPEEAVFSLPLPVEDTAPFSPGDDSYDAGPCLAGVPVGEPGVEMSDILEESPTFRVDMSSAARPELDSSPTDEQAIPPVSASIEGESEIVPVAEAEPEPIAEAHLPAEVEHPVEAQADFPSFESGDTVPEEEPTHAQPTPWMETVPHLDAPDAAPAGEPVAAMAHSGHPGRWDPRLEELFLQSVVTDGAPEPNSSREAHAAEMASFKRRLRTSNRRGPFMLTIFLLVVPVILLLAGGAFFFRNTRPAQELLRKFFPPSGSGNTASAVGIVSAVEKPAYEIHDVKSSYAKTFIGGNLFVIEGTVANVGKVPSPGIRVQATLLGKDNQALANNTVFAANLVDNTMLHHANRKLIEGFLGVRYGERNVNRDIPSGKSLPFMVVFFDPPGQIESFTVKALDAE